ncbi:NAD(+)/NADH kinase [[Eubacterium] cellulosolvens]
MRIGLVVNSRNKDAVQGSYDIIDYLQNNSELVITDELYQRIKDRYGDKTLTVTPLSEFDTQNLDLMVAVGGDGTILNALHKCNTKIFGINAGVVGFLTEVHLKDSIESLQKIINNDFTLDKRVRLKTVLNNNTLELATNEAVIHTADIAKMRLYDIRVDGIEVQKIRADGIIISTPTGSTSYAMSAGGPILDPKVDAFIIVPIAPFKLSARPLVVPSKSIIIVKLLEPHRNSVLVIDGQAEYELTPDDIVSFTRSELSAEFVRFEPNFYRTIEEKLTL